MGELRSHATVTVSTPGIKGVIMGDYQVQGVSFTDKGCHTLEVCTGADKELKVSVLHMQSHQYRSSFALAPSTPHSCLT